MSEQTQWPVALCAYCWRH